MKKDKIKFILLVVLSMFSYSCSDDVSEAEKRVEYTQIMEKRSSQDLMNDLYIACDGDIDALARVLAVTPSSIDRIRKGETTPTESFENKLKEVAIYYNIHDKSFSKLQSALDEEYSWYDSILNFPFHHPYWFWIITLIPIFLFLIVWYSVVWFTFDFGDIRIFLIPYLIEGIIFFIAWICMLIFSPSQMEDKYIKTINPVIEQMK